MMRGSAGAMGLATLLLLAPLAQATKLLTADSPECPCAQNAVASLSGESLKQAGVSLAQMVPGMQAPKLPDLKIPPAVPLPPAGPGLPPPPPAIPSLPPVPNVGPEDIPLQSMEGENMASWYTVPPSVAAMVNSTPTTLPPAYPPSATPTVPLTANNLMPRFLPAPVVPSAVQAEAYQHTVQNWPMPLIPLTGAPAPAPAPAAGFLQKAIRRSDPCPCA
mmetsp:Transcript_37883/g.70651  ORF Transcript_37883/g.70651 Transcript_37883/m.70651 type:complete len:219 (+) Transcript_37883:27-683(+)